MVAKVLSRQLDELFYKRLLVTWLSVTRIADHSSLYCKNIQGAFVIIIIQLGAQGDLHILKAILYPYLLYVQVCVHQFPPGSWSHPGPPVTLWMIAVTETCLIPPLMLGFWWSAKFDAVTRSNQTSNPHCNPPLCDTHTHSWPNSPMKHCI